MKPPANLGLPPRSVAGATEQPGVALSSAPTTGAVAAVSAEKSRGARRPCAAPTAGGDAALRLAARRVQRVVRISASLTVAVEDVNLKTVLEQRMQASTSVSNTAAVDDVSTRIAQRVQ